MQSDVDGGRKILNFSEWDQPQPALGELVDVISSGQMPPLKYRVLPNHAKARLSERGEGAADRGPAAAVRDRSAGGDQAIGRSATSRYGPRQDGSASRTDDLRPLLASSA